mmetsp:Transcript_46075/g.147390  ORF Transcript_46075/g.147390 Transcript_46075/m.147390 type:complete len:215 (+) Transcript_46075:5922-6566(+)
MPRAKAERRASVKCMLLVMSVSSAAAVGHVRKHGSDFVRQHSDGVLHLDEAGLHHSEPRLPVGQGGGVFRPGLLRDRGLGIILGGCASCGQQVGGKASGLSSRRSIGRRHLRQGLDALPPLVATGRRGSAGVRHRDVIRVLVDRLSDQNHHEPGLVDWVNLGKDVPRDNLLGLRVGVVDGGGWQVEPGVLDHMLVVLEALEDILRVQKDGGFVP